MYTKKLENIFKFYQKEYNLNTRLDIIENGFACFYDSRGDYINFGYLRIYFLYAEGKLQYKISGSFSKVIIFALLHEIKHAIDKELLKIEEKKIDIVRCRSGDREYHDSLPSEKRADNFAKLELTKWGV